VGDLTVNLMMAAFVVVLLRANRLTREQLAEVRVGMSLDEAHRLLGSSRGLEEHGFEFGPIRVSGNLGTVVMRGMRFFPGNAFDSTVVIPQEGNEIVHRVDLPLRAGRLWLGRDYLLWVQVDAQKVIQHVSILTYREEGGGIAAWLKHHYERWFPAKAATAPVPIVPPPPWRKPGS
jgi:hypothetical protein